MTRDENILARQCKGFLFPGTSSPLVVELARCQKGLIDRIEMGTYEEELVSRITVVRGVENLTTISEQRNGDKSEDLHHHDTPRP